MPSAVRPAHAAVLARLWGALHREPIDGVRVLAPGQVAIASGERGLTGPAEAALPFAAAPDGLTLWLDGVPHTDPGDLVRALRLPGATGRLAEEIDDSVTNLAAAFEAQPPPDGGPPILDRVGDDPLADLEQAVVEGHPLHPGCRTRLGLTPDEVRRYAPEHRPVVDLVEVRVPPERWRGAAPPVLIMHPAQVDRHGTPGTVVGHRPARPLMSLRTLALVGDPRHHVKTALAVQMTSAVRVVSPAAVHNGPLLSVLLRDLTPPGIEVIGEVAGAVDGDDGHFAVVHRRLPALAPGERAAPLAALTAPSPATGRPIATELADPLRLVGDLARLALPPLLALLAAGVALEAHGQNLLVVLRAGRPVRLLYRDLGGVRVSPARLGRRGIEAPPLRGALVEDDPAALRDKLFASFIATALAGLIAVLERSAGLDPTAAWSEVARTVRAVPGPDARALLTEPLPIKAMTAMRLAADPLHDVWARLPNPMSAA